MQGDQVEALTMTELRDELLVHSPLDRDWVARVNQASARTTLTTSFNLFKCNIGVRRRHLAVHDQDCARWGPEASTRCGVVT